MYGYVRQARLDRALVGAVERGDAGRVASLLREGADANARRGAANGLPTWTEVVDELRGRRVSSARGPTAILVALDVQADTGTYKYGEDDLQLVRALLRGGADPNVANAADHGRLTPLMMAATCLKAKTLRLLIEYGADVNAADDNGWNALAYAALAGDRDETTALLSSPRLQVDSIRSALRVVDEHTPNATRPLLLAALARRRGPGKGNASRTGQPPRAKQR